MDNLSAETLREFAAAEARLFPPEPDLPAFDDEWAYSWRGHGCVTYEPEM